MVLKYGYRFDRKCGTYVCVLTTTILEESIFQYDNRARYIRIQIATTSSGVERHHGKVNQRKVRKDISWYG